MTTFATADAKPLAAFVLSAPIVLAPALIAARLIAAPVGDVLDWTLRAARPMVYPRRERSSGRHAPAIPCSGP